MLFKPLLSDMRTLVPESLPDVSHSPSPHPERPFLCSILNGEASDLLHCILHFSFILVCWNLFYFLLYEASHRTLSRYCRDLLEHTIWWPLWPSGPVSQFGSCDNETRRELALLLCSMRRHSCRQPTDFPSIPSVNWWCFGVLKYVRGVGHCHAGPTFKGGYYKWSEFLPYFSLDNWIVAVFDIKTVILTCWVPAGMTLDMQNCPPLPERSFYVQCSGSGEQSASILAVRYHML